MCLVREANIDRRALPEVLQREVQKESGGKKAEAIYEYAESNRKQGIFTSKTKLPELFDERPLEQIISDNWKFSGL